MIGDRTYKLDLPDGRTIDYTETLAQRIKLNPTVFRLSLWWHNKITTEHPCGCRTYRSGKHWAVCRDHLRDIILPDADPS